MNLIIKKDFSVKENTSLKRDIIHLLNKNGYYIKNEEYNEVLLEKKLKFPNKGSTSLYLDLFIPIKQIKVLEINKMNKKIIRLNMYPYFFLIISFFIGILFASLIYEGLKFNILVYIFISIGISVLVFCIGVISAKNELFAKLDNLIQNY